MESPGNKTNKGDLSLFDQNIRNGVDKVFFRVE